MSNPLVKICGIRERQHAQVAAEAGADMIGVVFFPGSHRNAPVEQAAEVAEAARASAGPRSIKVVGLFVNENIDRINAIARRVGLDVVQLSGDETPEQIAGLELPYIATVRASKDYQRSTEANFHQWVIADPAPLAVILDTHVPGIYGGTGTVGDWDLAAQLAGEFPLILAGGLEPENVGEAIRRVRPYAVDVSSGVEADRRKDSDKIRQFIKAARHAQAATTVGGDRT
jgi:phosphoribosylanthranilate isomerase